MTQHSGETSNVLDRRKAFIAKSRDSEVSINTFMLETAEFGLHATQMLRPSNSRASFHFERGFNEMRISQSKEESIADTDLSSSSLSASSSFSTASLHLPSPVVQPLPKGQPLPMKGRTPKTVCNNDWGQGKADYHFICTTPIGRK